MHGFECAQVGLDLFLVRRELYHIIFSFYQKFFTPDPSKEESPKLSWLT